jgi:hypothetical protein
MSGTFRYVQQDGIMKESDHMSSLKALINEIINEQGPITGKVHSLLELSMAITGRGEIGDDYIKAIEFPINDYTIFSDPYYSQIVIYSNNNDGEIEIDDDETIYRLIDELKKRILSFDRKIKKDREEIAKKAFDKPLDFINFEKQ